MKKPTILKVGDILNRNIFNLILKTQLNYDFFKFKEKKARTKY